MPTRAQRQYTVAGRLVDVGRSLDAFNFEDGQYLSRAVHETMKEAERVFYDAAHCRDQSKAAAGYDRAEHLAKVVAYLVKREAPKFAANPKLWIETRRELHI
jgi:hypothetical protein